MDTAGQQLKKSFVLWYAPSTVQPLWTQMDKQSDKNARGFLHFIRNRGGGYKVIYGIIRLSKLINVDAYKRSKVSVNRPTLVDIAVQTKRQKTIVLSSRVET